MKFEQKFVAKTEASSSRWRLLFWAILLCSVVAAMAAAGGVRVQDPAERRSYEASHRGSPIRISRPNPSDPRTLPSAFSLVGETAPESWDSTIPDGLAKPDGPPTYVGKAFGTSLHLVYYSSEGGSVECQAIWEDGLPLVVGGGAFTVGTCVPVGSDALSAGQSGASTTPYVLWGPLPGNVESVEISVAASMYQAVPRDGYAIVAGIEVNPQDVIRAVGFDRGRKVVYDKTLVFGQ